LRINIQNIKKPGLTQRLKRQENLPNKCEALSSNTLLQRNKNNPKHSKKDRISKNSKN
jgi:hypothetical protein